MVDISVAQYWPTATSEPADRRDTAASPADGALDPRDAVERLPGSDLVAGPDCDLAAGDNPPYRQLQRLFAELRASEARFRDVANAAGEYIWELDADGRYCFVSDRIQALLGYTAAEALGKRPFDFMPPEEAERVWREFGQVVAPGQPFREYEHQSLTKSGELIWQSISGAPIVDEHGVTIGYRGVGQNITDRKRAEQALRQSEERFRRLLETVNVVPWEVNVTTGRRTYVGPQAEKLLGFPVEAWHASGFWRGRLHPEDRERMLGHVSSPSRAENEALEYRLIAADGRTVWVRDVVSYVESEDGAPVLRGFMFDVTDRKEAEEALRRAKAELELRVAERTAELRAANERLQIELRERQQAEASLQRSEEHFRSLIEHAQDIITILDLDGTIRYESPSVRSVLGYAAAELVGTNAFTAIHPDDAPELRNAMLRLLQHDRDIHPPIEFRFRHEDGSWRTLEAVGTVQVADGAPKGFVVNSRDITDRKQAEELLRQREAQLRQAQKMEAVGQLAGGIAHDFNNILGVIIGYSELLLDQAPPDHPQRAALIEINRGGVRAAELTQQLLAFSRQQVLTAKVVDLNEVVANVARMLRRLIGEDIELVTIADPGLGQVHADPGQLEQVLLNLAVNARDAMPHGGRLTIQTANVELAAEFTRQRVGLQPGRHVMLAVRDTGVGMDAETLAHIFEPFFTTKGVGKGTGLGLATVYGIVQQSNGHVEVASERGRGTTFTVYLPRVDAPRAETPVPGPAAPAPVGSEVVLVVEDEPMLRRLICGVLEAGGYTVLQASRGDAALDLCAAHAGPIHLIVTDVVMPGMSGRELAEQVCLRRPDVKILYLSGYTDDAVLRHGVGAGAPFLQKPFRPDALTRKVREVLEAPA